MNLEYKLNLYSKFDSSLLFIKSLLIFSLALVYYWTKYGLNSISIVINSNFRLPGQFINNLKS